MTTSVGYRRWRNWSTRVALILFVCAAAAAKVAARPDLSPTEQWILRQVAAGADANLDDFAVDDEDRVISSSFLRDLLTKNLPTAKVHPFGVRIWNARIRGEMDLTNQLVPYFVALNNCTFENKVVLVVAHFLSSLHFEGSTFDNPLDSRFVIIDGTLQARWAHFKEVNFEGMKVEGPVLLDGSEFNGPARFYAAKIGDQLQAGAAHFNDQAEGANFEGLKTGTSVNLKQAVFNGPATFNKAHVEGTFDADDSHFENPHYQVQLEGITVNGYFFIRRSNFNGPVRFYRAIINDNFEADGSWFNDTTTYANFESMTIKGHAYCRGTTFNGAASFINTTVAGNFDASGAKFYDTTRGAFFNEMRMDGVGFHHTDFKGPIDVTDMNYQRISSGTPADLLSVIERSKYDMGSYSALEQYYRRHGNAFEADAIYIKQRERERSTLSVFDFRRWWNLFLDVSIGYGRKPERVTVWSGIVVFIGALVFRREVMEPQRADYDAPPFNAFLFSLDLFLPIVDLRAANAWMPKNRYASVRRYLPVHVVAGWILVTIFVAALTGILK